MPKKLKTILALIFCIIAFAAVLIVGIKFTRTMKEEIPAEGEEVVETPEGLIINEVVASSRYSLVMEDGTAPDWIELYNGSSSAVSLNGLSLSDDPNDPAKCALPDVSVKAGEYLIVLCDGKENAEDGYVHAGFRLSSKGDYIGIFSGNREMHALEVPALGKDIAYGRNAQGKYEYLAETTPAAENSALSSSTADFSGLVGSLTSAELVISEYQVDNLNTLMDQDGEHGKWLEVMNVSNETVSLGEYALSDNVENMGKWSFPEITLEAGACQVVFLSGKDQTDGQLHTDFSLSAEEPCIVLSKKGVGMADLIAIDHTVPQNCSMGRKPDDGTWAYFPSPTPGLPNTTKSFARLDISEDKYLPDV